MRVVKKVRFLVWLVGGSSVQAKERANVLCNTYLYVLIGFVKLMG